ncbi:FTR1 family iron permease [Candidatus Mycalebacterium sp.]
MSKKRFQCLLVFAFTALPAAAFADSVTPAMTTSGTVAFISSFSIIVRESLEAVFIIAAMISALYAMGARNSVRFVHFGWIAAIAAGLLTWWASVTVIRISGAQAEIIEGVTSLLAALVLFYVSYWLISKIEVEKWKQYIDSKIREAMGAKNMMAITGVSFLAVYREALETVLFYQALLFQAEVFKNFVMWGLIVGVVSVAVLSIAIFKLSVRLPVKYMFSITGLVLYGLSFILVGKGIHELQEVGIISETVASFVPRLSTLGIYPTYETIVPQVFVATAIVFATVKIFLLLRNRTPNALNRFGAGF